jgi:hypothetical protein
MINSRGTHLNDQMERRTYEILRSDLNDSMNKSVKDPSNNMEGRTYKIHMA